MFFAPQGATNTSKTARLLLHSRRRFSIQTANAQLQRSRPCQWPLTTKWFVVNFNYRVGPLWLPCWKRKLLRTRPLSFEQRPQGSKNKRSNGSNKHITAFGGDPKAGLPWAEIALGGGSVIFQLTAYGGRNDNLFQSAAVESGAFPPLRTVNESQWQYNALLNATGCTDMNCMASMDAVQVSGCSPMV